MLENDSPSSLLEILVSYVPSLIARRFATVPALPDSPTAERQPAAVLLADISGFTALTERLAQNNPAGAETLGNMLNIYFARLIDHIQAHGGDIVKFAGDALLAIWPTDDEDLAMVTRRAAQCGLAIQGALHNYTVAEGTALSVRVGIGAGDLFTVSMGGMYGRWEFLVTGMPLQEIGNSIHQARPGDVVLSPAAWELVREACGGQPLADNHVRLEAVRESAEPRAIHPLTLTPAAEPALRAFLPAAIRARLAAGQTSWLSELRQVTIVFLNLPDLSHHTPLEQAQTVMQGLQAALYRYEGSVNKLSVDDKGAILVAALGLPPLAHEDDAIRGVEAALGMQAALRALNIRSSIGVTTGRVFCGTIGNDQRREYTMIGDVVNLAARLMQAAHGDILCDKATYQAARERLAFEALPDVTVKGKSEPVAVYRPQHAAKSSMRPKITMVGRQAERDALTNRLQNLVSETSSGVVVVEGEAGIGKSRLLSDLIDAAQVLNLRILSGQGDAIEKSTPYHTWRSVFGQFFNLDMLQDDLETRRMRVLAQMEAMPELAPLAPLLNAIFPLDLPDNALTAQMSGQVRADNTRRLVVGLLQWVASAQPLLLILEDAHWLDSASWDLTLAVSREVSPLLLVLATRPMDDFAPVEFRHLLEDTRVQRVSLKALAPDEVNALVCDCLGVTSLPEAVSALIHEKAEGHPFFSEELAYALRDSGLLLINGTDCQIAPGVDDFRNLSFPNTVQGVVTSRIDRLTPSQQLILKTASVVGRVFAFQILREIYPIQGDKLGLPTDLTKLERLDITQLETMEPDLAYIFKHAITQEVAYNLMLFAQRRELHQAVAAWYERTYPEDLSPYYPILAYHWERAEDIFKTLNYLERAGAQALHGGIHEEAINFFSSALALNARHNANSDSLRLAAWERQLGQAYLGLGNLEQGGMHLRRALMLVRRPEPAGTTALMGNILRQVARQAAHRLMPRRFVRAQGDAPSPDLLEATRIYCSFWDVYLFTGEKLPLLNVFLCAINLAERTGQPSEMAQAYANMCLSAGLIPLHGLARLYSRLAQETIQKANDLNAQSRALLTVGIYWTGIGNWDGAKDAFHQVTETAKRLGDWRRWEESAALLGVLHVMHGEFRENIPLAAELYAIARRNNHTQAQQWGLGTQFSAMRVLGQLDEAEVTAEASLELIVSTDRLGQINVYGELAALYIQQGKRAAAHKAAEIALDAILHSEPTTFVTVAGTNSTASAFLSLWEANDPALGVDAETLRQSARQSCEALTLYARLYPITRSRTWRLQGLYDWLDGKQARALKTWQKSLDYAVALAMPYDEGLIRYEIGRHLPTGDPQRQTHLLRACEIFERQGNIDDLQNVAALL